MSTPEDRAQVARIKWLLQLTGQAVKVSGFTDKVIDILAPAMSCVMQAEGFYVARQSTVDREIRELETDAT